MVADVAPGCEDHTPAPGCTDIWIDEGDFQDEGKFIFRWEFPGLKTFAVDDRGVHFVDHMLLPGSDFQRREGLVGLVTYDSQTALPKKFRRLDVYPPGLCTHCRLVQDFAIAPDGAFAILIGFDGEWRLVVGHLDHDAQQVIDPGWGFGSHGHAVDWDGEAFALHGNVVLADGSGWGLTRFSSSGASMGPTRPLKGRAPNDILAMRYAVDAASGRTYVLNELFSELDAMELCGHERNGDAFPDVPNGCFQFGPVHDDRPQGTPPGPYPGTLTIGVSASQPFAFAEPATDSVPGVEYAFFSPWPLGSATPRISRVYFPPQSDAQLTPVDWRGHKLISREGDFWPSVVTKSELGIERKRFDDSGLVESVLVVWSPADRCKRFNECPAGVLPAEFSLPALQVRQWRGEGWLEFKDNIEQTQEECPGCLPRRPIFRVVKMGTGCQYLKANDAALERKRRRALGCR